MELVRLSEGDGADREESDVGEQERDADGDDDLSSSDERRLRRYGREGAKDQCGWYSDERGSECDPAVGS